MRTFPNAPDLASAGRLLARAPLWVKGLAAAALLGAGLGAASAWTPRPQAVAAPAIDDTAARRAEFAAFAEFHRFHDARELSFRSGETLAGLLARAGARRDEARQAVAAIAAADARRIEPGQAVNVVFERRPDAPARLVGLAFRPDAGLAVTANRTGPETFAARAFARPLTFEIARANGPVGESLEASALAQGATSKEIDILAGVCGHDLDFQRDVGPADRYELVFERIYDDEGATVRTGELLFIALDTRLGPRRFYAFAPPGSKSADWYDTTGQSARRALMKTPVNGARLSSTFGARRHPILGFTHKHQGVDFAAPFGEPVLAAGDGVVLRAGPNGSYGNYLRLQHAGAYSTAYAHMTRFASGMRPGARVKQGQIIGYVGSTGRSTGPHLHYEVMLAGVQINPMTLNSAAGRNLSDRERLLLLAEVERIDALRANLWRGLTRAPVTGPVTAPIGRYARQTAPETAPILGARAAQPT